MLSLVLGLGLAALPFAVLAGALLALDRFQTARRRVIERQVLLTDAIHRELGAVAAPVVTRRPLGPWRVDLAVPLTEPALVGRLVAIAERQLAADARDPGDVRIVLHPRAA